MYWFQKIKFSFLFLLAIVASGFFVLHTASAYEYNLWASRKYYSGNSVYIVGTWDKQGYEQSYFTWLWYCTWYYYVNHDAKITNNNHNNISTARQVFYYDEENVIFSGDYINSKLIPSSIAWNISDYWFLGNDFRFDINRLDTNSPYIPKTYTLGRFWIKNNTPIADTKVFLKYLGTKSLSWSTFIDHTSSTFDSDADTNYSFDIKYYAQPCVPDMHTTTQQRELINGSNASTLNRLSRIPAIHGLNTNEQSWKPITIGSSNFANTGNFIPASINLNTTFNKHISFDNWIYFAGIKEPDKSSTTSAYSQKYHYSTWDARWSWFSVLDSTFVSAPESTTNQWWINPDTVKVIVTFTWVDNTKFEDNGSLCTILITWDNLGLSGLGYSWNRNQLWYSVNITSGIIRSLAHTQCQSLSSIPQNNIDLKRETVAHISWDAYDYSNSMIISQEHNTVTYANPNRITGTTWYSFNSYSGAPNLYMSTDNNLLSNWITVYNVPINNNKLQFTGTDKYAWVNSGKFLIIVSGYSSSIKKSNSRRTSWTPEYNYIFSGADITKSKFNPHDWRFDYTGFVYFATHWTVTTGMHFTVHFEVEDFVWNKTVQNYTFRTPTYPNNPKSTGNLVLTTQTKQVIDEVTIKNNILNIDSVDWWWDRYNYSTYYPLHRELINDFAYISGASSLTENTNLVLTATNGNLVGATTVTMTWLTFNYDWSGSTITWIPYVSSGWEVMSDYLDTTFTFDILATNIYGITGVIKYNINVSPSCTESPGCTDPVYVFWWTTLSDAQSQRNLAINSGTEYMKSNHWYPHWFAEIRQTWPNFYFTWVVWENAAKALYCSTTGNNILINYNWYAGPQSNELSNTSFEFTWQVLSVTGGNAFLFDVFTASISAEYITENINWTDIMTIYVNRPLTGRVFYSICPLTGWSLDVFGCPEVLNHNRTWDINWTQLTDQDTFTMTWWIEWWWMTWTEIDNWGTGFVSNGWWTRKYTKNITGNLLEEINTTSTINIENRTWAIYTINHEVYWIDNTEVSLTWIIDIIPNQSATVTLSGYNTGQLSAVWQANLIWDDEYIVTKFSGDIEPMLFENWFDSTIKTWQFYINWEWSNYKMIHKIVFAQDREWEICVVDRAGNESCFAIDVFGIGEMKELIITARPAFRPESSNNTGYSILDWDFWFWVKSWSEWTQNYNSAKNNDPKITINKNWTGLVYIMTPPVGSEYLVVFKWSGTLSAWFTGIWDDSITDMNFFTGTYADNLSQDYVYKLNNAGIIENYLKVWDIWVSNSWQYDSINTEDFSLINHYLTKWTNYEPGYKYRYDFDINNVVSSMEQSMILQAWGNHWFIGRLNLEDIIPMTWFINL